MGEGERRGEERGRGRFSLLALCTLFVDTNYAIRQFSSTYKLDQSHVVINQLYHNQIMDPKGTVTDDVPFVMINKSN